LYAESASKAKLAVNLCLDEANRYFSDPLTIVAAVLTAMMVVTFFAVEHTHHRMTLAWIRLPTSKRILWLVAIGICSMVVLGVVNAIFGLRL